MDDIENNKSLLLCKKIQSFSFKETFTIHWILIEIH